MKPNEHNQTGNRTIKLTAQQLKFILPLLLMLLVVVILMLLFYFSQHTSTSVIKEHVWKVNVVKAKSGRHAPDLTLYGQVESYKLTTLESAITADVIKVPARAGNFVKQNDLLIQLDDRETKIEYKQRKGELDDLKAQIESEHIRYGSDKEGLLHQEKLVELQQSEVTRLQYLFKRKVSSASLLDKARLTLRERSIKLTEHKLKLSNHKHRLAQLQARLLKAEAKLEQAALDLERTKITAPFTGRITKVYIAVGNRAQKAEKLLQMFATDAIEVRAQIPTPYLRVIKNSLITNKKLNAKALVDHQWLILKLDRLAGVIESGQGGVDAIFSILNDGKGLAQGRVIELKLQLPALKEVFPVPPAAIYNGKFLYIVKDHRLISLPIQQMGQYTDKTGRPFVLVHSAPTDNNNTTKPNTNHHAGLTTGDLIVTTHLPSARTGLKVSTTVDREYSER